VLRRASPEEGDAVAEIYRAAKAAQSDVLPDLHTPEEHRAFYGAAVREHEVWVADEDGGLVGFAFLKGEMLSHLFVLPAAQGRGVGKALLDKTKERLPDGFTLWTHQPNVQARRFYEREGLVPVEFTDGATNEEGIPDVRYAWRPPGRDAR
jgi:GNAT superfamily N-acetyltransferase